MAHACTWTEKSPVGMFSINVGPNGIRAIDLQTRAGRGAPCRSCLPISAAFKRYLAGDARALEKLPIDLGLAATDFHRTIYETLRKMAPPGATTTYGELAAAAGKPGAARAVGSAMARNPVPIVVPCHRVLASGGGLGGYGGGLEMKRFLLKLEGARQ